MFRAGFSAATGSVKDSAVPHISTLTNLQKTVSPVLQADELWIRECMRNAGPGIVVILSTILGHRSGTFHTALESSRYFWKIWNHTPSNAQNGIPPPSGIKLAHAVHRRN